MSELRPSIRFSVCDILKQGIGSSSSHTLAPWRAALACHETLRRCGALAALSGVTVTLHGSLAFVGRGHYTTVALPLGLLGKDVATFDVAGGLHAALGIRSITRIGELSALDYGGGHVVDYAVVFDTVHDTAQEKMVFDFAYRGAGRAWPGRLVYYSYGGGSFGTTPSPQPLYGQLAALPYMYSDAATLLARLRARDIPISQAIFDNELVYAAYRRNFPEGSGEGMPVDAAGVVAYLRDIAVQMGRLIHAGCTHDDADDCYQVMYARPRAKRLYQDLIGHDPAIDSWQAFFRHLLANSRAFDFGRTVELVSIFALAVSEQNAALKHVVTAPTNGSCGTVPAVLYYYVLFHASAQERAWLFGERPATGLNGILRFLLTASAIGGIVKGNANISGGVGGCQAEVGTSASMAAGALADVLGALSPTVACNAAAAALVQHLGSTCDPVGGLVEVPCIDRNLTAAVSAITLAREMTQLGPGYAATVPFDQAVTAMQDISESLSDKYKETSTGGLALVMREDMERRRPDLFPPQAQDARARLRISIGRTTC